MQAITTFDLAGLLDVIGAGCDPQDPGPVVIEAKLWCDMTIKATYYRGDKKPDIDVPESIIMNDHLLLPLVQRLLGEGAPFIVRTGTHDEVCTLEWTIQ